MMMPLLAPTLAELRVELDRANGLRAAIPDDAPSSEYDAATKYCWAVLDQIAETAVTSLADLRIKAYAFDWAARLTEDEPYHNPSDGEAKIMHQLVAGLLDESLSSGRSTAHADIFGAAQRGFDEGGQT